MLLSLRHLRDGIVALITRRQVEEEIEGALPQFIGGWLVVVGARHILYVSDPDTVGGYPFLLVDLDGSEDNLVSDDKDML